MQDSKMHDASQLLSRKRFEAGEKERRVVLLSNMISDFEKMIVDLDGQIAAEEDLTRIKDTEDPQYSFFAKATAKRRQNLLSSVAHVKSMLDVAGRELREVMVQVRDLDSIQNDPPRAAHASSAPNAMSALR